MIGCWSSWTELDRLTAADEEPPRRRVTAWVVLLCVLAALEPVAPVPVAPEPAELELLPALARAEPRREPPLPPLAPLLAALRLVTRGRWIGCSLSSART